MSTFNMSYIKPDLKGGFLCPFVTLKSGEKTAIVNSIWDNEAARNLAYVAMAVGEPLTVKGKVNPCFTDVTKTNAGKTTLPVLETLPKNAVFAFHRPTKIEDEHSTDTSKHTAIVSVSVADMIATASLLSSVYDKQASIESDLSKVATPACASLKVLNTAPIYHTPKEGEVKAAGKSRGTKVYVNPFA